jgi:hypothetical protein
MRVFLVQNIEALFCFLNQSLQNNLQNILPVNGAILALHMHSHVIMSVIIHGLQVFSSEHKVLLIFRPENSV